MTSKRLFNSFIPPKKLLYPPNKFLATPLLGLCTDVHLHDCVSVFTSGIAIVGGSVSKQMTLNGDLDLSKVNSDNWRRCSTSVPNFVAFGLVLSKKSQQM